MQMPSIPTFQNGTCPVSRIWQPPLVVPTSSIPTFQTGTCPTSNLCLTHLCLQEPSIPTFQNGTCPVSRIWQPHFSWPMHSMETFQNGMYHQVLLARQHLYRVALIEQCAVTGFRERYIPTCPPNIDQGVVMPVLTCPPHT